MKVGYIVWQDFLNKLSSYLTQAGVHIRLRCAVFIMKRVNDKWQISFDRKQKNKEFSKVIIATTIKGYYLIISQTGLYIHMMPSLVSLL